MENGETLTITKEQIVSLVIESLKNDLHLEEDFDLNTSFEDDLFVDNVQLYEAIEALEEEFVSRMVGFSFDERDLAELETVGNLVDIICKQVFPKELDENGR